MKIQIKKVTTAIDLHWLAEVSREQRWAYLRLPFGRIVYFNW